MARMVWTEKKIERMHAEGYGSGSGSSYKPWIAVQDVSSQGRSRRVWSPKTERVHHFLSDVEYKLFLTCEWAQNVIDIREQYPLDRTLTQEIAGELRIAHPTYVGTRVMTVMTVDLLLTIRVNGEKRLLALNAKRDEEAEDAHSLEKLEIQRRYFAKLNIPHYLVYHLQLPSQKVRNLEWIRGAQLKQEEPEPHPGFFQSLCSRMANELAAASNSLLATPLAAYAEQFDARHGLEVGTGLRVARMLMEQRVLMPDLAAPNLANSSLDTFAVTGSLGTLRAIGG